MKKNLCEGCSSKSTDYNIHGSLDCSILSEFNGEQCPCIVCIVKSVCHCNYEECENYHIYSSKQIKKEYSEELEIPCTMCKSLQKCIEKIKTLKENLYDNITFEELDENDQIHDFFLKTIIMLGNDCKEFEQYFPYVIVGRDGGIFPPNNNSKHEIISEDEWHRRNPVLFYFVCNLI